MIYIILCISIYNFYFSILIKSINNIENFKEFRKVYFHYFSGTSKNSFQSFLLVHKHFCSVNNQAVLYPLEINLQ